MKKTLNIAGTVLITLTILAAITGALRLSWIVDDCEEINHGQRCIVFIVAEPRR